MGGEFRHGFLSGFAGSMGSYAAQEMGFADYSDRRFSAIASRTAFAAVVGGTASALGGGKFANGAITAAFQHLFNHEHSFLSEINPFNSGGSFAKQAVSVSDSMGGMIGVVWGNVTGDDSLVLAGWGQIDGAYADSALGQTENGPGWAKYGTRGALTVASTGTAAVVVAETAPVVIPATRRAWKDIRFNGPNAGFWHMNGRAFNILWRSKILIQIDYHGINGMNNGRPFWHYNSQIFPAINHMPVFPLDPNGKPTTL